jgi:UDP-glucuronate 4-epimerase
MGHKALIENKPLQPGDMLATNADCELLHTYTGYKPATPIQQGITEMVTWYKSYRTKEANRL